MTAFMSVVAALMAGAQASPLPPMIQSMNHHVVAHANNRELLQQEDLDRVLLLAPEIEVAELPKATTPFEILIHSIVGADVHPTVERISRYPDPLNSLRVALIRLRTLNSHTLEKSWTSALARVSYLPPDLTVGGQAWSKRFLLYGSLAMIENNLQPVAQYYSLKSLVKLSGRLKHPVPEEQLSLMSQLIQSSQAARMNPLGYQELLFALTPEKYRELDYERVNEELLATPAPWLFGSYSQRLQQTLKDQAVRGDEEYQVFARARELYVQCSPLFSLDPSDTD